jgi:Glutamine amidotransferases class-II
MSDKERCLRLSAHKCSSQRLSCRVLNFVLQFVLHLMIARPFCCPTLAFVPLRNVNVKKRTCLIQREHTASLPSTALACQLLGMNSRNSGLEFNLQYVWPSFCERGGSTDIHSDGWGLAYYYQGKHGLRQFHDVEAASTSPLARFLADPMARIRTTNMMAHIRYATTGSVDLANVHPFSREYVVSIPHYVLVPWWLLKLPLVSVSQSLECGA